MNIEKYTEILKLIFENQTVLIVLIIFFTVLIAILKPKKTGIIKFRNVRFTLISDECVRLEYSPVNRFIDLPSMFAINRNIKFKNYKLKKESGRIIIETSKFKLSYIPDGKIFSPANLQIEIKNTKEKIVWKPGMSNRKNLGGTVQTLDCVSREIPVGEGFLSKDGWYLFDDSSTHIFKSDWVESRKLKENIDWYFFAYGLDYKSCLKAVTEISGKVPIPRKYALGFWYSRYWPYSSDDYRNIVNEFKNYDIPLDVIVLDMDWHRDGWTGWSWNKELFPDWQDLLKWFHQQNLAVTLNVHPADGVGPHEDMYIDFMKDLGENPKERKTIPFDAGNKKYLDTLFKWTHIPYEEKGVDFWWLDWQQEPFTKSIPDLLNLKILNYYYYQHSRRKGKRGLSFSRWAGAGDHRHPVHFSGDTYTGWSLLKFIVPFTATAGNILCFYWSHDIGGHWGPRNEEIYARWLQFGVTSPVMRLHSTRDENLDRRPWKYSPKIFDSAKISFNLRARIMPYLYSTAWQVYNESIPIIRPMYLEYPENENSYKFPQQYMFGDAFLCAPIVSMGYGENLISLQTVWFPEGTWYNFFTGEKFEGDYIIQVTSDINEFPFFVKGGFPVVMQNYNLRPATTKPEELTIRCYPLKNGETNKFTLYEDDGISEDYLFKSKYALTTIECKRVKENTIITIWPVCGNYHGLPKKRSYIFEFPWTEELKGIDIKNKSIEVKYDKNNFTNILCIAPRPITEKIILNVKLKEIDKKIIAEKTLRKRISGFVEKTVLENLSFEEIVTEFIRKKSESPELRIFLSICGTGAFCYEDYIIIYNLLNLVENNIFKLRIIDRFKGKQNILFEKEFTVERYLKEKIDVINSVLPETEEGITVKRFCEVEFFIKSNKIILSEVIRKKETPITIWNFAGPYPFDIKKPISEQKYEPELKAVNLMESKTMWKKYQSFRDTVDIKSFMDFQNSMVYGVTYIYSEKTQNAFLEINSDSRYEIFINGIKEFSREEDQFFDYESDRIKIQLKEGNNEIMIKCARIAWALWTFKVIIDAEGPVKISDKGFW